MPDYDKMTWIEVVMFDGFKFIVEKDKFMGNYANLVGQHISRLAPYNHAYQIIQNGAEQMKVKKYPDDTLFINFNQTIRAQRVTKKIEVVE